MVAATVALVGPRWLEPGPRTTFTLEVRSRTPSGAKLVPMAKVGDEVTIAASGPDVIWVYRGDGTLMMRCPGEPACRIQGRRIGLAITARAEGRYRVLAIGGVPGLRSSGTFDADVLAVRARGGTLALRVFQVVAE